MQWPNETNLPVVHMWTARYCIRWYYSAFFCLYGILLLLPGETFGQGRMGYTYMAELAPEVAWGCWMFYLGLVGFYGVLRRGCNAHIFGFANFVLGTATMWWLAVTPFVSAWQIGYLPAAVSDSLVTAIAFTWCALKLPIRRKEFDNGRAHQASI